jgi:hypothetical protein
MTGHTDIGFLCVSSLDDFVDQGAYFDNSISFFEIYSRIVHASQINNDVRLSDVLYYRPSKTTILSDEFDSILHCLLDLDS